VIIIIAIAIGYSGKLIGDPTGPIPDVKLKVRYVYEEEMKTKKVSSRGHIKRRGIKHER
jgi:hypothetical protein